VKVECADSLEWLAGQEENSIDGVLTDPPYGLEFMGKEWDGFGENAGFQEWCRRWGELLFRAMKPGAYALVFGGTRTYHRLVCGLEDAGFEVRNSIHWFYGSGFPKNYDVSKGFDKKAGVAGEIIGKKKLWGHNAGSGAGSFSKNQYEGQTGIKRIENITAPATALAKEWHGYGTALKPAHEPIVLLRKPLEGSNCDNAERWGTGALNVDGCRIKTSDDTARHWNDSASAGRKYPHIQQAVHYPGTISGGNPADRWPPNLVLSHAPGCTRGQCVDGCPVAALDEQSGELTGGASRFFPQFGWADIDFYYCAKTGRAERNAGCGAMPEQASFAKNTSRLIRRTDPETGEEEWFERREDHYHKARNDHPTVKPVELLMWLSRLIIPKHKETRIVDPFGGSGSSGIAWHLLNLEGYQIDGVVIDKDRHYCDIAEARIAHVKRHGINWLNVRPGEKDERQGELF